MPVCEKCSGQTGKNKSRAQFELELKSQQGIHFYRFPKNPELRERWEKFCGKPSKEDSHLCSVHFKPDSFYLTPNNEIKLKANAVPEEISPLENVQHLGRKTGFITTSEEVVALGINKSQMGRTEFIIIVEDNNNTNESQAALGPNVEMKVKENQTEGVLSNKQQKEGSNLCLSKRIKMGHKAIQASVKNSHKATQICPETAKLWADSEHDKKIMKLEKKFKLIDEKRKKKITALQQNIRRKNKKISEMRKVMEVIRKMIFLDEDEMEILKMFSRSNQDLIKKQIDKVLDNSSFS